MVVRTEVLVSLPSRLRLARQEANLTQQRAAELAGVEPISVWRYENGQREPSASTVHALASLYGKPVEWFFEEDTDPEPDFEADMELVMNEASLALRQVSDQLSPEAIRSIASFIRFVHENEEKEREGER